MPVDVGATQIGAYHLADNPNLYEIQRDNNFEFIVTGVENLLRVEADESDADPYITNAQDILKFSVNKASIPMFQQDVITINRGNSVMKAAGKPTFPDGSIEVHDFIGADTKSVLMSWQNLSYNVQTERVGNMADYKKTCYLQEYTPDYKLVRTWKMYGCWISQLSEAEFTHENSGKKVITATIQYDKAVMELPDQE